jgi:hypothetical protein
MLRSSNVKSILAVVLALPLFGTGSIQPVSPVTVHEWGTFTSVTGIDGESVAWAPLRAAADLPCFVHSVGPAKYWPGLVRMETPVDYFYTQTPARISVHVDFPDGTITEWYPKAVQANQTIDWNDLNILPGATLTLPSSKGASRYYAARETDSAPLQSGNENEKVLFYRGMGNFKVPLEPTAVGNGIFLRNIGAETIPLAILFENQDGRIGYRVVRDLKNSTELYAPDPNASFDSLRSDLTAALEQSGLYPKEAAAMIETWRDSWFEQGMRVIYLMPRAAVDKVLPLRVTPAPRETQRVFVGRVELLSPWTERTIRAAMETNDTKTLDRFERFLAPFLAQIRAKGGLNESPLATKYAQQVAARVTTGAAPCIQ